MRWDSPNHRAGIQNGFIFAVMQAAFLFMAAHAGANERIGNFSIEEVHLRPTVISRENEGAELDLEDSNFSIRWRKDKHLSAYFAVGSTLSRVLPAYYNTQAEEQLGLYEAYAEYAGVYGTVRMGLLPLNFGYDGVLEQSERIFKRALPYSERVLGMRDLGISYYTSHNGFYTEVIAHNGEIDNEQDGRVWTTGRWGWTDDRNWRTQLSLQTGRTRGDVTTGSGSTVAGFKEDEGAIWRHGTLFLNWYSRQWNVVLAYGGGEVEQKKVGRYAHEMAEVSRFFTKNLGLGARYDRFDPNTDVSEDAITEASLSIVFKSNDSTSNLYLVGLKRMEEGEKIPNDEIRLVWSVTPYAR